MTQQRTALGLKLIGDNLYAALPILQRRIEDTQGVKDLAIMVLAGDIYDQTAFADADGAVVMRLTVRLVHPDGVGDVAAATFRACTYALFTVLREQLRHRAVREGGRRRVPGGTELEADMPIGGAELRMRLEVS